MNQRLWVFATIVAAGLLIYLLGSVLTPFMLAAVFAYLGNPIVERLERRRVPRTIGVIIVFAVFFGAMALALTLVIPPLETQMVRFVQSLPRYANYLQQHAVPALGLHIPSGYLLDVDKIKSLLGQHLSEAGGVAAWVASSATSSGVALFEWALDILLVPVVTFYLMRDWDELVEHVSALLPRRSDATVLKLAREVDETLSAFVRGQLLVMVSLAVFYSLGLWLTGLDLGLFIGMASGLINVVPYLGFIVGIITAAIASLVQSHDPTQLLWIAVVFAIGKVLEDMVLTPLLIGDRIGLHPVAVIFAILAGGQLFGFLGILLALPIAAILAVLWRYARTRWIESHIYRDEQ